MQKMKNGKKVLSVCLSLAMAAGMLSTSAFASWNVYGGSNNHNAVVTEAPTTPDKSGLDSYIQLHCTGSGWDGVDNVPVMQTVNGTTYAYVLYDGYGASGALVAKIRCAENGGSSIVWTTDPYGTEGTSLNAKSGFQLSTPYLDDKGTPDDASDDTLYVGTISQYDDYEGGEWLTGTGSKVMALTGLDQNKPTVTNVLTGINGQINTPITTDGTYLYFGTWPGGSNAGTYYQVKLSDYSVKTFTPDSYGFYWAGAVSDGTNVYFGSDNGLLYWRSIADFDTTGGVLDLTDVASDAGNVRSTVMMDEDGFLYFTTQGGYLWCCSYKDGLTVVDGKLTAAPGGGLCQLSNLLFWLFLHAPLTVVERHGHGTRDFPDPDGGMPLGVDATISEGWLDLKVKNETADTFQLRLSFDPEHLTGRLLSSAEPEAVYRVVNGAVTYCRRGGAVYEEAEVVREKIPAGGDEAAESQLLYRNVCRIGYPLPEGIPVIEKEKGARL